MTTKRAKIALWHRYGPADHVQCGGHSIPLLVERLARTCEVHYFGMRSRGPVPPLLQNNAALHALPFFFNRASTRDKFLKTILWYLAMPCMALRCRLMGVRAIFIDETLPLTAPIVRLFFGRNLALTVQDFFLDIYFERSRVLKPVCRLIKAIDFAAWRHVPVIFTKVNYTHRFLIEKGVPAARIHTIYNPCDRTVYKPVERSAPRARFGYGPNDIVLVHHGILHPNKGNDFIIRAIAELRGEMPGLRYLLIGDGPEMHDLKRLAADLHIADRITFTGWLPGEQAVNEALNAGDIGLVMRIGQWSDNFHLTDTLAHEMACGLPILAARLEGIAEVIADGRTGCLFEPGNTDEFKSKLRLLYNDPQKRAAFGRSSRELCETFCSVETAADRTAAPLLRLVEGK